MLTIGGFNWLDLFLLVCLGFGLTVGYVQGLLRQIIGLGALYIATILAAQYDNPLANFLRSVFFLSESRLLNAVSFFIILVGVSSIINFLAADAYRMTKLKMFPLVDFLGGSIVGFATMVILISLTLPILTFVTAEPLPYFDQVRTTIGQGIHASRLVPIFELLNLFLLRSINPWIPGGLPLLFNL